MKISASLYSNKDKSLSEKVRELDALGIDMFHIDCCDDDTVFDDIRSIRQWSKTPIDLHIISSKPEQYFAQIAELGIEYVSFQYENLLYVPDVPELSVTQWGLSVVTGTDVSVFDKFRSRFSFLMLMATRPGESGGVFGKSSFRQIIELRQRYPKARLHVDGGVNDRIAFVLRLLGVHVVVSGSYLMNHEHVAAGMLRLHRADIQDAEGITTGDFTIPLSYLPVLPDAEPSVVRVLDTMERYAMGFVLFTNPAGVLTAVVSNADVRRSLLRHKDNFNDVVMEEMKNPRPVTVPDTYTVPDLIRRLNELSFIVLFLPVTDASGKLKGVLLLNHLTRV